MARLRTLDQLQHEGTHALDVFHAANRAGVRMIEGCERQGFALEAREAIRIAR